MTWQSTWDKPSQKNLHRTINTRQTPTGKSSQDKPSQENLHRTVNMGQTLTGKSSQDNQHGTDPHRKIFTGQSTQDRPSQEILHVAIYKVMRMECDFCRCRAVSTTVAKARTASNRQTTYEALRTVKVEKGVSYVNT